MRLAIIALLAVLTVESALVIAGPAPDPEQDALLVPLARKAPQPWVDWTDERGNVLCRVFADGHVEADPGARYRPSHYYLPASRLSAGEPGASRRVASPSRRASRDRRVPKSSAEPGPFPE